MNILLTNDDGYDAPGLLAAFETVSGMGTVHVIAPKTERSAGGHAITLRKPITVERMPHAAFGEVFAVDGTPADCVRLAEAKLVDDPIDLVVSGINRGANAGVDIYYSGTVAAAREAAMFGIPAVAFSQALRAGIDVEWGAATRLASVVMRQLLDETLPGAGFWNVNFPAPIPADAADRIRQVDVAVEPTPTDFECKEKEDGRVRTYKYSASYWHRRGSSQSDYSTLCDGDISVSAIPVFGRF